MRLKLRGILSTALVVALAALPAFGRARWHANSPATNAAPQVVVSPTNSFKIAVSPTNSFKIAVSSTNRVAIAVDGAYYSKDDVAKYIRTYGRLPKNFITKNQARQLGWTGGPLEPYAPGKAIGGDHFGNYENKLPWGRYKECDIDTKGKPRGSKRIIFSEDKRLYYTFDHYNTFEKIP